MLLSIIEYNNCKSYLYIDDSKNICGYTIKNGKTNCLDKSVLNDLSLFKLSNDNYMLPIDKGYLIIKDNYSGLLHYFKDGKEDLKQLYYNNGCTGCLSLGVNNSDVKRFDFQKTGKTIIISSFVGITILYSATSLKDIDSSYSNPLEGDITLTEIHDYIYKSININNEEKDYLYNEDFLNDMLPYLSNSEIKTHYDKISIVSYSGNSEGAYNPTQPNILFVSNYNKYKISEYRDTISHEFIHLNQASYKYPLLNEASAEIISYEYYDDTSINAYSDAVRETKAFIEIVGPEYIWNYNFNGDYNSILELLNNNLEISEVNTILDYFSKSPEDIKDYTSLNNIFKKLYENLYGESIDNDEILSSLLNGKDIDRYYFNTRKMKEESIIISSNEYYTISLDEAYNSNLIEFYKYSKVDITNKNEAPVNSEVFTNYSFKNCKLSNNKVVTNDNQVLSLSEATNKGYVSANYYYISEDKVSIDEYKNNISNGNYYVKSLNNIKTVIQDNKVNVYAKKVTVSSIKDKFSSKSKKKA